MLYVYLHDSILEELNSILLQYPVSCFIYILLYLFSEDPWTTPEDYIPLEFPLPSSYLQILRFRVFEDFHSKRNYYLTPGTKFGGDFLAYPGS